jgi:hypothetical protein
VVSIEITIPGGLPRSRLRVNQSSLRSVYNSGALSRVVPNENPLFDCSMDARVKAVVVTLGAVLLLYGLSFFSRTDDARWMNREPTSAPQTTQRRSSPPSDPDSGVSQLPGRPDPVVTSSLSTAVPASTGAGAAQMPKCCSQSRSKRSGHSAPAPSREAPASEPETPNCQTTPERGGEPIQFSLADRGN